jgi:hypothetical protein
MTTSKTSTQPRNRKPKTLTAVSQSRPAPDWTWSLEQWLALIRTQQRQKLKMQRLQDVADQFGIHINSIRSLYDPASDGYDADFPPPVLVTNAQNARAIAFVEWEITAYAVLQIARSRGFDIKELKKSIAHISSAPSQAVLENSPPELTGRHPVQAAEEQASTTPEPSGQSTTDTTVFAKMLETWSPVHEFRTGDR